MSDETFTLRAENPSIQAVRLNAFSLEGSILNCTHFLCAISLMNARVSECWTSFASRENSVRRTIRESARDAPHDWINMGLSRVGRACARFKMSLAVRVRLD